jgi:hypothetical protein
MPLVIYRVLLEEPLTNQKEPYHPQHISNPYKEGNDFRGREYRGADITTKNRSTLATIPT